MQKSHFNVFTVANPPRFAADSTETQEALTAPAVPKAKSSMMGKINTMSVVKILIIGILLVLVGCTAVRLITTLGNSLNKVIKSIAGPLAMWTDLEKAKLSTGIIMAIVGALSVPLTALIVAIASRVSSGSKTVEATAAKTGATTAEISKKIGEETRPAVEKAIDQFKSNTTREPNADEKAVIERSMTTRVMARVSKETTTVSDPNGDVKNFIFNTYTAQQDANNTEGPISEEAEKACNDVEPGPDKA